MSNKEAVIKLGTTQLQALASDFARRNGFDDVSVYTEWNGHLAFDAIKQYEPDLSDFPDQLPIILVIDGVARWATAKESSDIVILFQ